ncbi:hypothetical protein BJY52DRAFT_1291595 [Lactarius psammicola]|nr:hypothetical protein BJY52DRAFT_1291595 [Lactarius psammicola]
MALLPFWVLSQRRALARFVKEMSNHAAEVCNRVRSGTRIMSRPPVAGLGTKLEGAGPLLCPWSYMSGCGHSYISLGASDQSSFYRPFMPTSGR